MLWQKYILLGLGVLLVILPGSWVMALETTRRKAQDAKMAAMAVHDDLTGLPNRRAFEDHLNAGIKRAQRYERRLGLLYIDLDGFKAVNDTYGHAAGDELLISVGRTLTGNIRQSDRVARLGGDEFACILVEVDSVDGAMQAAAHLLTLFAEPFLLKSGTAVVGASIGVAVFPDHATKLAALVRAADRAMYRAKRDGKNRCVAAQVQTTESGAGD